MPETYSKPCQISKMVKHIELWHCKNSLFRYFQAFSGTFSNTQPLLCILREIKAYKCILMHCRGILSHIQAYSKLCVALANTTMPYLELRHI